MLHAEFQRLRITAHHPQRRMRALRRLHGNLGTVGMKLGTVKRERLGFAERRAHVVDEFECRRFALAVVETKRTKVIRIDAGHEAEFHAAAEHLIDDRNLLGKPQRMIERNDVAHRPDPHAFGTHAGADGVKARRRHPAFVGAEVMLDAKGMIEAELVAQLQLTPQLFVALMRRHARLGPDVRKMREFHRLPHAASLRHFRHQLVAQILQSAKQSSLQSAKNVGFDAGAFGCGRIVYRLFIGVPSESRRAPTAAAQTRGWPRTR